MGGMIAQSLAIHYPDRFESMTSIMSSGYYYDPELGGVPKGFMARFAGALLMYSLNLKPLKNKIKLNIAVQRYLMGKGYEFELDEAIETAHYEWTRRKGFNPRARDIHGGAIIRSGSRYAALTKLDLPSLIIHGTADPLVTLAHANKYAPLIPNAEILYLEDMGHHFPKQYTGQMTAAIIDLAARSNRQPLSSQA